MAELIAEANQQSHQQFTIKQPIIEAAVYSRDEAVTVTGFSLSTLLRAEQRGKLKGRYQGRRRYYIGRELLDFVGGDDDE
jgi:hypothetical protein